MSPCFLWVYVLLSSIHICRCVDLTYNVQEGKSPGTYVGDVAADLHLRDRIEPGSDGQIMFSLLKKSGTMNSQMFRISRHTGKLFTAQTLDAESLCMYNTECFKMVDIVVQRANSFMKILKIKVIIDDINDHPPEFPYKEISVHYSEGDGRGMRKLIPHAIDRDVSILNSRITYELKKNKNNPFTLSVSKRLDGTSLLGINLDEKLDREAKDSYMIQVIAKDGGLPPKESVMDVYISVTDVNDNTPVFSQDVYNFSVKNEILRATPVTVLSATDLDSGGNGKITYHFSSRTSKVSKSHFELNELTGEIFLQKKFSAGEKLTHKLFVEATDGGTPPLTSIAKVLVNVINIKNHPPNIDVSFFSASTENTAAISEEIDVGSFIAYVIVTDHDVGQNGEVTCSLHHEKFLLENLGLKEYKITIKNPLDREIEDHHEITIRCQDKALPPLHSESKFSIKVIDANDERPQFTKEVFKFWINENQKSKLTVGSISATDPDLGAGGQLSYSLLTSDEHFLPFQISENGLISTVISLDHEFQDIYDFQVLVKDNGIPSLNNSVKVVVEVKDKNDNVPYFTFPSVNPFTMDVLYYPHQTSNITVLRAADSDSHENAFLKYEIRGGNDKQLFTINHYTGLLSFTRVVTQQDAGTYNLEFVVKDSGNPVLSASTTLFLKLTVSNQTSTMLNAVHIQSDNKIRLYLLIVTVLVAVTVSIPLTAAISICIIRCIDRRNTAHSNQLDPTSKCPTAEDTHSICSSYQARYWSGVSVAVTADQDMVSRTLPAKMKKTQQQQQQQQQQQKQQQQQQPGNSINKDRRSSSMGIKVQTATEVLYEVSVHWLYLF